MALDTGLSSTCYRQDDILFQLTERLREREEELQQVCRERDMLADQLHLRGNLLPLQLDLAYEDLLAHCKEREEEFKEVNEQHERRSRELEHKCHDLQRQLKKKHKLLDKYEEDIMAERDEMENNIRNSHHRLLEEIQEKERHISSLEDMVDRLKFENNRLLDREEEHETLISRLRKQKKDVTRLEVLNSQLEEMLCQKEKELKNYILFHQDEMMDMNVRVHEVIDLKSEELQEREKELAMLTEDIKKYEDILDEADYITHEQRLELKAREKRIHELSLAIERIHNTGFLAQVDNMCTF